MWCHLPRQRLSRFACIAFSVAQLCPTLCNPMDCGLPCSSVHGILQARLLEWIAVSSCRVSSWPMSGWSPRLLRWQVDSLPLSHLGSLDLLAIHYKRLGGFVYVCVCVCVCVFWSGWGHKMSHTNKKLMQPAMLWVTKPLTVTLESPVFCQIPELWQTFICTEFQDSLRHYAQKWILGNVVPA